MFIQKDISLVYFSLARFCKLIAGVEILGFDIVVYYQASKFHDLNIPNLCLFRLMKTCNMCTLGMNIKELYNKVLYMCDNYQPEKIEKAILVLKLVLNSMITHASSKYYCLPHFT